MRNRWDPAAGSASGQSISTACSRARRCPSVLSRHWNRATAGHCANPPRGLAACLATRQSPPGYARAAAPRPGACPCQPRRGQHLPLPAHPYPGSASAGVPLPTRRRTSTGRGRAHPPYSGSSQACHSAGIAAGRRHVPRRGPLWTPLPPVVASPPSVCLQCTLPRTPCTRTLPKMACPPPACAGRSCPRHVLHEDVHQRAYPQARPERGDARPCTRRRLAA